MRSSRLLAGALLLANGCIAPSVVTSRGRAVADAADAATTPPWHTAAPTDLLGLFGSESIEGAATAALVRVFYWFAADGSYSGAALVAGETTAFQTLAGRYTLRDGVVDLDGVQQLRATARPGELRLEATAGSDGRIVLRRLDLE